MAPEGILALLGFNALFYFNILLSVALFLTVLLTLSRWYRDSEMIVWLTSGQGLTAWLKPILWFASPFLIAIAVLSLWLSPWAEQRRLEYERQLESREELSLLAPGLFKEFKRAKLVVFIESINSFDGTIRNIFLHSIDSEKDATTVARSGRIEDEAQRRPLYRARGRTSLRGQSGHRRFSQRGVRPPRPQNRTGGGPGAARIAQGSSYRIADPRRRRDRARRAFLADLGADQRLPAGAAGHPLSYVNPRMGRSFNLFAALFAYMLYFNCLNIVQSFVAQGRLSFVVGLLLIHTIAASVVIALFHRRLSVLGMVPAPPTGMKTLTRYIGREVFTRRC